MSTRLRRKALQDFYHIQNASTDDVAASIPEPIDFDDDKQVEEYVTKSNIEHILALRNTHTDKLNLLKLTKKSIIYDNYSELINLSNVLKEFEKVNETKEEDFEALLDDLVEFSNNKVSVFNVDFKELLLVDDDSSMKGTVEMGLEDDGIDKHQLMTEITHILTSKKLTSNEGDEVEKIIDLLQGNEGSLLKQQLMEIKRK